MKFIKNFLKTIVLLFAFSFANPAFAEIIVEMPSQVNQGWPLVLNYLNTNEDASINDDVRVVWRDKPIKLALKEEIEIKEAPKKRFSLFSSAEPEPIIEKIGISGSIILAMPTDQKGKKSIEIHVNKEVIKKEVEVIAVTWPKSTLSVAPKYVEPPAQYNDMINKARRSNANAFATTSDFNSIQLPLVRPAEGTISSPFGVQRVYNGKLSSVHYGTDFRGPTESDILAVADGIVLVAEEQYYSGNTIIIDHGQNVFSLYMHLNSFDVEVGEEVKAGVRIGGLGTTGRSTGPHLHLGLRLNGFYVDAMPLFDDEINYTGPITVAVPRPAD